MITGRPGSSAGQGICQREGVFRVQPCPDCYKACCLSALVASTFNFAIPYMRLGNTLAICSGCACLPQPFPAIFAVPSHLCWPLPIGSPPLSSKHSAHLELLSRHPPSLFDSWCYSSERKKARPRQDGGRRGGEGGLPLVHNQCRSLAFYPFRSK